MKKFLSSLFAFGVCTATAASLPSALFGGGSSPQDVAQLTDMEKMTDKEIEFAGTLTGDSVEAFIQMTHMERSMAMDMVKNAGGKITATDAVMAVKKQTKPAK